MTADHGGGARFMRGLTNAILISLTIWVGIALTVVGVAIFGGAS